MAPERLGAKKQGIFIDSKRETTILAYISNMIHQKPLQKPGKSYTRVN
jgi:hypothetical protein